MYVVNKFSFRIARSVPEMFSLSDGKKWPETSSESINLIIREYVLICSQDTRFYDNSDFALQSLLWERQNKSGFTSCHLGQECKSKRSAKECKPSIVTTETNSRQFQWIQAKMWILLLICLYPIYTESLYKTALWKQITDIFFTPPKLLTQFHVTQHQISRSFLK